MVVLVRMEGFEPSRGCPRQLLKLVRLPFRHIRALVRCSKDPKSIPVYHAYHFQTYAVSMYQEVTSSNRSAGEKIVAVSMPWTLRPTT
jgi:hypothetical protein